jgi:hypothetical protein
VQSTPDSISVPNLRDQSCHDWRIDAAMTFKVLLLVQTIEHDALYMLTVLFARATAVLARLLYARSIYTRPSPSAIALQSAPTLSQRKCLYGRVALMTSSMEVKRRYHFVCGTRLVRNASMRLAPHSIAALTLPSSSTTAACCTLSISSSST